MSLLSIISNATQQLLDAETQIGVVSNNVGNAQNPNYVEQNATIVDLLGGGQVVNVSRAVNQTLQQELLAQSGGSAGAGYANQVYQQLENLTGSSSGSPTLSTAVQALVTAFQDYQAQPESTATQNEVMTAAQGLASDVHSLSTGIETVADQTQTQTQTDVKTLNSELNAVAQINQQIVALTPQGKSVASLEDQRDADLASIASLVPVNVTNNADGSISVATPGGVSLVSGSNAVQFAYTPFQLGTNGTAGTDATVTIVGDSSGTVLNSSFAGGKIGTELDLMRVDDAGANSTDPNVAPFEKARRQLDALVDQFYNASTPTAFQSAYNTGLAAGSAGLNLFVINNPGPGGNPQTAGDDRDGFVVNPNLLNGTATLNAAGAQAVVQALTQNSSTTPISAGDVTNFTGTISDLATAITAAQSQRANKVSTTAAQSAAALTAVQTSYSNSTGVSVDQQLSELIVLQNSYNASAKVISVADSMVTALETALGAG